MAKRQWTTHDEDWILGADPPFNGLLYYKLGELFHNTNICMHMHGCVNEMITHLPHLLHRWRKVLCSRLPTLPQSSPQPQQRTHFDPDFVQRVGATIMPSSSLQFSDADQLSALVESVDASESSSLD